MTTMMRTTVWPLLGLALTTGLACKGGDKKPGGGSAAAGSAVGSGATAAGSGATAAGSGATAAGSGSGAAPTLPDPRGALDRATFNRMAVRRNVPLYWVADRDGDKSIDDDETVPLLFYPAPPVAGIADQVALVVGASREPAPDAGTAEGKRLALVHADLDGGRPTLVETDARPWTDAERTFLGHMLEVASLIDQIYAVQTGAASVTAQVAPDPASQSLFRRNRGPGCAAPKTEKEPGCSAIPGAPTPAVGMYPAKVDGLAQRDKGFCEAISKRKNGEALMDPFVVVAERGGQLAAVPYPEADGLGAPMAQIATLLTRAADALPASGDGAEPALRAYLKAAARSFASNDWKPADEAWAKMNVDNSRWYLRVGPDETYWDPCAQKAGFHLTLARINPGSKDWQGRLAPLLPQLEAAIAARAGKPYKARKVSFHLPDFIDIVVNAGDDRDAIGATIGQSLPNWGPVATEGRGRTVAMVNLYTDADSIAASRRNAEAVLDAASLEAYSDSAEADLLGTILHEATHNLGPASGYKVGGKDDAAAFSGPIASVLEELKAQTGALFLVELLRGKGLVTDATAAQSYTASILWAFGHVAAGMYDKDGGRTTYSQLSAIQLGLLLDGGALVWNPDAPAANGTDKGAFTIQLDRMVGVVDSMMGTVAGIKARGDRAAAEALLAKYVDSDTLVPHKLIVERFGRQPKVSFVYTIRR
jgi:hypothetical protein